MTPPSPSGAQTRLGAPKTVLARGTYEALNGAKAAVQQANQNQTGKRLRETLTARTQDLSATVTLARANALITQAGANKNKKYNRNWSEDPPLWSE